MDELVLVPVVSRFLVHPELLVVEVVSSHRPLPSIQESEKPSSVIDLKGCLSSSSDQLPVHIILHILAFLTYRAT